MAFVKRILRQENLLKILFNANNATWNDQNELKHEFERVRKRLECSGASSTNEALQNVERVYLMSKKSIASDANDEQNNM